MQILYTHMNIFDIPITDREAVFVTTNGDIRNDGRAVMGAGIAKEAKLRFGGIDIALSQSIQANGNGVYHIATSARGYKVLSFPTKHHWRENADIELIKKSAYEAVQMANQMSLVRCYLTPPGCANGHLNWEYQVKHELEPILDDRFTVVIRQ